MKRASLSAVLLFFLSTGSTAQPANEKLNSIGISIPVTWNNSEGVYYSLGKRKTPAGKAVSYGITLSYNRIFFKKIYGAFSLGYLKQQFDIDRPFKFDDPTLLLFFSKDYQYDNIVVSGGIGRDFHLYKGFAAKLEANYSLINSFRQKYTPKILSNASYQSHQVNHKKALIGHCADIRAGLVQTLGKRFSVTAAALFPLSVKWKNDDTFFEYDYANDTQIIAYTKSSFGVQLSCNYHF